MCVGVGKRAHDAPYDIADDVRLRAAEPIEIEHAISVRRQTTGREELRTGTEQQRVAWILARRGNHRILAARDVLRYAPVGAVTIAVIWFTNGSSASGSWPWRTQSGRRMAGLLMTHPPPTQYAQSGDISIAYQVSGNGPIDLIVSPGYVSHLDLAWDEPSFARCLERLGSFARLIRFDKRGTGLSDREAGIPSLEQRTDDIRAVLDAAGSRRAAILGVSEGGPMSVLFAATYPERTEALILYGTYARTAWAPDYAWRPPIAEMEARDAEIRKSWGTPAYVRMQLASWLAPSMANDERFCEWAGRFMRLGASPGAVVALRRMNRTIDVRDVLSTLHVPTLILRRRDDPGSPTEDSRYLADRIPGAKFVEIPGDAHFYFVGDSNAFLEEIEEFLTGERSACEPDRVLATVLVTDICDSTRRASVMGDRRWRVRDCTWARSSYSVRTLPASPSTPRHAWPHRPATTKSGLRVRCGTWWRARVWNLPSGASSS